MTQARWQKLVEWPLTVVAVVFLVAYAWEVIADLQGPPAEAAEIVIWATWTFFLVDYVVDLALAPKRWKWFYTHIFDLLVVVLPMLRPLRLLRLVTLISVLHRTAGNAFRSRVIVYAIGASSLLVFVATLAVLDVERPAPGATITTFGDALWWAFVTITTVGYGDFAPVTVEGRFIAAGLMLGGIALLGIVTATLASWIVERVAQDDEDLQAFTRQEFVQLSQQISLLRETIAQIPGAVDQDAAVPADESSRSTFAPDPVAVQVERG
jgi:voltage-gated potassium channel